MNSGKKGSAVNSCVGSIVYCHRKKSYGVVLKFIDTPFGTAILIKMPDEIETRNVYDVSAV